jgi:hypothetical protein
MEKALQKPLCLFHMEKYLANLKVRNKAFLS